jgi:hypothetical protein
MVSPVRIRVPPLKKVLQNAGLLRKSGGGLNGKIGGRKKRFIETAQTVIEQ